MSFLISQKFSYFSTKGRPIKENTLPKVLARSLTLYVGDTYNPLVNVTATDKEDGNITLTNDNIIVNDVNTSKAGTYHVTYKVTDKNGTSSEKSITVTVQVKNTNISVNTDKAAKPSDTKQSTKTNTTKSASPKTGLPKTGDTTNVAGVFGGLVVSLGALLALLKKKRS